MNGTELGRQVARAAIAGQTMAEITDIMARMMIRAMLVDMMARPLFSAMLAAPVPASDAVRFATGGALNLWPVDISTMEFGTRRGSSRPFLVEKDH